VHRTGQGAGACGPQEGERLDSRLRHLADRLGASDLGRTPGADRLGFAGQLLGGRIVSGADFFLDLLDFYRRDADCVLLVTGEGRMDNQTLAGKRPAEVARRSQPLVAIVGRSDLSAAAQPEIELAEVHTQGRAHDSNPIADPAQSPDLLVDLGRTNPLPARRGTMLTDHRPSRDTPRDPRNASLIGSG